MNAIDIVPARLALAYILLIIPLVIMLWYRIDLIGATAIAAVRMTLQLAFVGIYLQFVFDKNSAWLNAAWLIIMVAVADLSIIRGCGFQWRRFALPLFVALIAGTIVPLFTFTGLVLQRPHLLDARFAIPIGGMILGNCLRADIIGIKTLYNNVRQQEKAFLYALAQGARLHEALRPFIQEAFRTALAPTLATMSTIGLVSLPGMMTGVILGGTNPAIAIKYQIAIMISIFSGTTITIALATWLTTKTCFTPYGTLDHALFPLVSEKSNKKNLAQKRGGAEKENLNHGRHRGLGGKS